MQGLLRYRMSIRGLNVLILAYLLMFHHPVSSVAGAAETQPELAAPVALFPPSPIWSRRQPPVSLIQLRPFDDRQARVSNEILL